MTAPGDANDLRARLRRALPAAIKARDQTAIAALRSALAAIDNAEAVGVANRPGPGPRPELGSGPGPASPPAPAADEGPGPTTGAAPATRPTPATGVPRGAGGTPVAGAVGGLGAGEVERRHLTAAEIAAIVRREVAERRTAARAYQQAGRPEQSERLRAEADLLGSYLGDPETPT